MVGLVLDGVRPGLPISIADFEQELDRRRSGAAGTTPRKESDVPRFLSGVYNGFTTGAPLTIAFENADTDSSSYDTVKELPRPGHADFVASKKFNGFQDHRGGGHFSGRLTVCLVAAGIVARKMISALNNNNTPVSISARLLSAGDDENIERAIAAAIENQDSIGGIVECRISNVTVGFGEPFFDSFESVMSHAVFSIPAIKGIEFGSGFSATGMKGSEHNDALIDTAGKYASNHSGGVTGGISNGNDIVFRVAVKPASSTPKEQSTLNVKTGDMQRIAVKGRHDLCIALRVPPVLEALAASVLADFMCLSK